MTESPPEVPATPAPKVEPTLTQADVDRIVADRVAREKAKYADHADLKAKAARLDEIEAANATELDKAVKAARDEGTTAERTRTSGILAAAEARAQAAAAKFRDVSDAVKFLDLGNVKVSEDGEVDAASIKTQLDALATAKPYLLNSDEPPDITHGQAGIGVSGGGVQPNNPRAADMAQIEADLAATKRR